MRIHNSSNKKCPVLYVPGLRAQENIVEVLAKETQMADMDFVEALEYGVPPSFGFGLSERLFSFHMDMDVREARLFPLMRPNE